MRYRPCAASLVVLAASAPVLAGIHQVEVHYEATYRQVSPSSHTLLQALSYQGLYADPADSLTLCTVTQPGGATTPIPGSPFGTGVSHYDFYFGSNEGDLLAARPAGNYTFHISGGTSGTQSATLLQPFPSGGWPSAIPAVDAATYNAMQDEIDPTQDFTITLNSFTAPPSANYVQARIWIQDLQSTDIVHFAFDTTSVFIPGGTLQPGRDYDAWITFIALERHFNAAFSGEAQTLVGFQRSSRTFFRTSGEGATCYGDCVADFDDGSGNGTPDEGVTIDDLLYYLGLFEAGESCADVDDGSGTNTQDGGVTIDDLIYFLTRFEEGC
jgi:hypothetical protein